MEIIDTSQKLEKALDALAGRESHYAEKRMLEAVTEHAHKLKRAVEIKKAEGTIKDKEAAAEIECEVEFLKRLTASAESDIAKEMLLDVRTAVSARQSILNAETRTERTFTA